MRSCKCTERLFTVETLKWTANELSAKFEYSVALSQLVRSEKEERRAMRMLSFKWHCAAFSIISEYKSDTPEHLLYSPKCP